MTNSGSDFSGVKVGDRLWLRMNSYDGEVTVAGIDCTSITVHIGVVGWYPVCLALNGTMDKHGPQVLFYDKVEIIPPPRPKRMVKKTIEVRPYKSESSPLLYIATCDMNRVFVSLNWCGPVQTIVIEVWE